MKREASCPKAFTLIELLVVLAIIGAIAAIILPVFASVRARAKQTACLSNMRQIALAVQQYAQDNNSYIPPYNSWYGGTFGETGIHMVDHGAELVACLNPYIHDRDIWFCPADIYAGTPSTAGDINHRYLSYGTSLAWFDHWLLGNRRIDFTTPNAEAASSQGLPLFQEDLWGCHYYPTSVPPPYSHNDRFNQVMFDGHVTSISWEDPKCGGL